MYLVLSICLLIVLDNTWFQFKLKNTLTKIRILIKRNNCDRKIRMSYPHSLILRLVTLNDNMKTKFTFNVSQKVYIKSLFFYFFY